jgi:GcrA cell cycle regulator
MNLAFENTETALSEVSEFNRIIGKGYWSGGAWSDADIKILSDLVADKFSARQIATVFKGRHTRSAVIGKCHRMGLQLTGSNKKYSAEEARIRHIERERARRQTNAVRRVEAERVTVPTPEPTPYHLTVQQLQKDECRWPYGQSPYTFCGHKKLEGSSYCPYHHKDAYRRPE